MAKRLKKQNKKDNKNENNSKIKLDKQVLEKLFQGLGRNAQEKSNEQGSEQQEAEEKSPDEEIEETGNHSRIIQDFNDIGDNFGAAEWVAPVLSASEQAAAIDEPPRLEDAVQNAPATVVATAGSREEEIRYETVKGSYEGAYNMPDYGIVTDEMERQAQMVKPRQAETFTPIEQKPINLAQEQQRFEQEWGLSERDRVEREERSYQEIKMAKADEERTPPFRRRGRGTRERVLR